MKCRDHPYYKAERPPTLPCLVCWGMYRARKRWLTRKDQYHVRKINQPKLGQGQNPT